MSGQGLVTLDTGVEFSGLIAYGVGITRGGHLGRLLEIFELDFVIVTTVLINVFSDRFLVF